MEQLFQIAVRVRPLLKGQTGVWAAGKQLLQLHPTKKHKGREYSFGRIYQDFQSTAEIYKEKCQRALKMLLQGQNSVIMCYGQTNAGKTYTVLGEESSPGLVPYFLKNVFQLEISAFDHRITVSYIQIYRDKVYDLLNKSSSPLQVDQNLAGDFFVRSEQTQVRTYRDALALLVSGEGNRIYRSKQTHQRSSRSHVVFTIKLSVTKLEGKQFKTTQSQIQLVDLAGSQRLGDIDQGQMLSEGVKINKSLSALCKVVYKLQENAQHIPYRQSSLTKLIKRGLTKDSLVLLICCVSVAESNCNQTVCTLDFATRALKVKRKAKPLRLESDQLGQLRLKVEQLSKQLILAKNQNEQLRNLLLKAEHKPRLQLQLTADQQAKLGTKARNYLKQQSQFLRQQFQQQIDQLKSRFQQAFSQLVLSSKGKDNLVVKKWVGIGSGKDYRLGKADLYQFQQISVGGSHNLAISGGEVFGWGCNDSNQISRSHNPSELNPFTKISFAERIVQVSAGGNHSLALTAEGLVYAWGGGQQGQLGIGRTVARMTEPVNIGHGFKNILAGHQHSVITSEQDGHYFFGCNVDYRCFCPQQGLVLKPTRVKQLKGEMQFALGTNHSLALKDGQLWASGNGTYGQLCIEPNGPVKFTQIEDSKGRVQKCMLLEKVQLPFKCTQICAGQMFSLLLSQQGKVFACGKGSYFRLGLGGTANALSLTQMRLTGVQKIRAGSRGGAALTRKGWYSWGFNLFGQLGMTAPQEVELPTLAPQLQGSSEVHLGHFHTISEQ